VNPLRWIVHGASDTRLREMYAERMGSRQSVPLDVFNQCSGTGPCDGLNNFWRSLSNLTLNVTLPNTPPAYVPATGEGAVCNNTFEYWAVSQAAPMRRVIMNGNVSLQDFCNRGFVTPRSPADRT
jgi:hypothetical protein